MSSHYAEQIRQLSAAEEATVARLFKDLISDARIELPPPAINIDAHLAQCQLLVDGLDSYKFKLELYMVQQAAQKEKRHQPREDETAHYRIARAEEIRQKNLQEQAQAAKRDAEKAQALRARREQEQAAQIEVLRLAGYNVR